MTQATLIPATAERWAQMTPGERIVALLEARGSTLTWLGERLGMYRQLFHLRVSGAVRWRPGETERIAELLGVPVYCIWPEYSGAEGSDAGPARMAAEVEAAASLLLGIGPDGADGACDAGVPNE